MNETSSLLTGLIARIPAAPMFLTQLILGGRAPILSGNARVKLQLYRAGQKLAPISTAARGGVIMTHYGYDDIEVEAPLLAPMWDMTELTNTIAPGELSVVGPDGNVLTESTSTRKDRWRGLKLAEAVEMVRRRKEWMLSTQLTTGKIVLRGEGGYNVTIDLGWDNNTAITTAWDAEGGDPIEDIRALQDEASIAGIPMPNVLVLSPTAGQAFINNAKVASRLQANIGQLDPILDITRLPYPATRRIGYIREIDLMVYAYGAQYDNDGTMTPFIPAGTGVLFPSADVNSAMHANGAIHDTREDTWFSGEYYVREFSRPDGHADFLEVDARPVACLCEAESWYNLTGLTSAY